MKRSEARPLGPRTSARRPAPRRRMASICHSRSWGVDESQREIGVAFGAGADAGNSPPVAEDFHLVGNAVHRE